MLTLEKLLDGLMVEVEPFVLCREAAGSTLYVSPVESATLHYVVAGVGSLDLHNRSTIVLAPGTMVSVWSMCSGATVRADTVR